MAIIRFNTFSIEGIAMTNQFSIAEAKNKLPSLVHAVEKGPAVKLTRHGRPVAVLLSIRAYEYMQGKSDGFWNGLVALRRRMEIDNVTITGDEFADLRDNSPGRTVS
jgi:prevent-host-death family protein